MNLQFRLTLQASRRLGRGDYQGAAECYREIVAKDPQQWGALLMLAHCHQSQGRHPEALGAAMRAVAVEPGNFLTLRAVAETCVNTGDHRTAKLYVEKALAATPVLLSQFEDRVYMLLVKTAIAIVRLVPRYRRRFPRPASLDLDGQRSIERWKAWAGKYLAWHAQTFGPESAPSVN